MASVSLPPPSGPRIYGVNAKDREPLLAFMLQSLHAAGCTVLKASPPNEAPFRIAFETPQGERLGVVAYAFLVTRTPTKNRPSNEVTFQIEGREEGNRSAWRAPVLHEIRCRIRTGCMRRCSSASIRRTATSSASIPSCIRRICEIFHPN